MGGLKVAAAGLQVRVEVTQLPPPSAATLWGYPVANPGCSARIKGGIWQGNGGDLRKTVFFGLLLIIIMLIPTHHQGHNTFSWR